MKFKVLKLLRIRAEAVRIIFPYTENDTYNSEAADLHRRQLHADKTSKKGAHEAQRVQKHNNREQLVSTASVQQRPAEAPDIADYG